eukprot:SM000238S08039  [mRNA]  locus=s238:168526:179900:+ [translate_table: standard]
MHQILDLYKVARLRRKKRDIREAAALPPGSVVLLAHSMGGLVARAAASSPRLRAGAVATIVTLSSPHQASPAATQPSLARMFRNVNSRWRRGYATPNPPVADGWRRRAEAPTPSLRNVVVVSIAGGTKDRQVRSALTQLRGVVPPTHGISVGTTGMPGVWLPMDHQCSLWCNQLVVKVARTLLLLVDPATGQMFGPRALRHAILARHLRGGLPQALGLQPTWHGSAQSQSQSQSQAEDHKGGALAAKSLEEVDNKAKQAEAEADQTEVDATEDAMGAAKVKTRKGREVLDDGTDVGEVVDEWDPAGGGGDGGGGDSEGCPLGTKWIVEPQDTDIFVQSHTVEVLALDGRQRWLDIRAMAAQGRTSFALLTNLHQCASVRIHLWEERRAASGKVGGYEPPRKVDVTLRMIALPASEAATPSEPGTQRQQPAPTGALLLGPAELARYRFVTVEVAPQHAAIANAPPPREVMAVAQFYDPLDGAVALGPWWVLSSLLKRRNVLVSENHPMVLSLALPLSPGAAPLAVRSSATQCGLQDDDVRLSDAGITELCKQRCFAPVAAVWDPFAGGHDVVSAGAYRVTVQSDATPALGSPGQPRDGDQARLTLLIDPHCAYTISIRLDVTLAIGRFILAHGLQVAGIAVGLQCFALLWQARAQEAGLPAPPLPAALLASVASSARGPPILLAPLTAYVAGLVLLGTPPPPFWSVLAATAAAYLAATAALCALSLTMSALFAVLVWMQQYAPISCLPRGLQTQRAVRSQGGPAATKVAAEAGRRRRHWLAGAAFAACVANFLLHPGAAVLLATAAEAWAAYGSLARLHHGLLCLHLLLAALVVPSFVAWLRRPAANRTLPALLDAAATLGVAAHALQAAATSPSLSPLPQTYGSVLHFSSVYAAAGVTACTAGLARAPHWALWAISALGAATAAVTALGAHNGDSGSGGRRSSGWPSRRHKLQ